MEIVYSPNSSSFGSIHNPKKKENNENTYLFKQILVPEELERSEAETQRLFNYRISLTKEKMSWKNIVSGFKHFNTELYNVSYD